MENVRYAIVGAGWISQIAFMPAVPQTGNSTMTAIITGNAENAAKLAAFYGIEHIFGYDDYDAALASGAFDAVYIGLPNSLHADFAIRALQAGVHALVEKPLAISVEQCEAMIAAAREGGALLMTAYRLHCEPGAVEAIRLIREGAIGTPRFFSSIFSFQAGDANHRLKAEHWGGPLQDIGVYCLNAARHAFGAEPTLAMAMKGHGDDPRFTEVEETISATLRFPGDAIATFTASFNAAEIDMHRIVGTEGEIEMQLWPRSESAKPVRSLCICVFLTRTWQIARPTIEDGRPLL
jgi:predicted dehydrogenase